MSNYQQSLNPDKALIFRIVHRNNIPWILKNGLYCGNHSVKCPEWVSIGNPELIDKRKLHPVPCGNGGYLNDYIPFYFTPFSPMLLNIKSGRGVPQSRTNEEIVILVSSLKKLQELGLNFVFTDMHAYYAWATFYTNLEDLNKIDWKILQDRDFKRDENDPQKFERYQAEALIHEHCPTSALLGIVCYDDDTAHHIKQLLINSPHLQCRDVITRPAWYF